MLQLMWSSTTYNKPQSITCMRAPPTVQARHVPPRPVTNTGRYFLPCMCSCTDCWKRAQLKRAHRRDGPALVDEWLSAHPLLRILHLSAHPSRQCFPPPPHFLYRCSPSPSLISSLCPRPLLSSPALYLSHSHPPSFAPLALRFPPPVWPRPRKKPRGQANSRCPPASSHAYPPPRPSPWTTATWTTADTAAPWTTCAAWTYAPPRCHPLVLLFPR